MESVFLINQLIVLLAGFLCNFLPLVSNSAKVILKGKAFAKMPKTLNAIEKASSGMDKVNKVIRAASLDVN